MADEAQIGSDISAATRYRRRPRVLNQNVRALAWQEGCGAGRQAWRGPDRGLPLSPSPLERTPPSLSVAFYRGRAKGVATGGTGSPWDPATAARQRWMIPEQPFRGMKKQKGP